MRFGIKWLFAATFLAAAILGVWQLSTAGGYIMACVVVPAFIASLARIEFRMGLIPMFALQASAAALTAGAFVAADFCCQGFLGIPQGYLFGGVMGLDLFCDGFKAGLFLSAYLTGVMLIATPYLDADTMSLGCPNRKRAIGIRPTF